MGVHRDAVAAAQRLLNSSGAGLSVDGQWGPKTQAAYDRASTSTQTQVRETLALAGTSITAIKAFQKSGGDSTKRENRRVFNEEVVPYTLQRGKELGFAHPEFAVAQMRHESNNGASTAAAFNYAGLTPAKGEASGTAVSTFEYIGGVRTEMKRKFASFESAKEFVDAYYNRILRLWPTARRAETLDEWTTALRVGENSLAYATAPRSQYLAALERQSALA